MIINNVDVSFDVFNPETLKRFQAFVDEYQNGLRDLGEVKAVDQFPKIYEVVVKALDGLFGPGMGARICGSEVTASTPVNAVLALLEEHKNQIDEMQRKAQRVNKLFGELPDRK